MLARATLVVLSFAACRYGFEEPPPTSADDAASDGSGDARDDARGDSSIGPPPDAGMCEPIACDTAGGSCVDGACELVASSENSLRCPAGMPCRLICHGYRYCRDGVSCNGATWCEVSCVGERACQDGVACGSSQCEVTCDGEEACESGITLTTGTCVAHCCGVETCLDSNPCMTDQICN